jgi:hypothetical protein
MIFHYILLRMGYVQTKFAEKVKRHILCSQLIFSENPAAYEVMWKNIVGQDRPQMITHRQHAHYMIKNLVYRHTLINMQYVLLFHGDNGYANAPQCYLYMYIVFLLISVCVCVRARARARAYVYA